MPEPTPTDPTYQRELIDANPAWKLAFYLSELDNDNAPIGWGKYIRLATVLTSHATVTPRHQAPPEPAPPPREMIDDEKKLAETPAGFLLFKFVESLERAWKEDARLADTEPTPKRFLRVREGFRIADQYRAALVRTMLDEPNIARMLDVSTAHLPTAERADLVTGNLPGQMVATVYGGIINTATWEAAGINDAVPDHASEALRAIMQRAVAGRCQYVMFDADAPALPGYPTFDEE